jgi:DNA-binding GntR family transcriptional regulator
MRGNFQMDVSLTSEAYKTIKKKIIDLHLRPGEILIVQQLAMVLNISRTPVREALVRLAEEGLLDYADGRKFKVSELPLNTIIEIYEVRQALECFALGGFINKATQEHIYILEKKLELMKTAILANNYELFYEEDMEFHNLFLEISGNKTLQALLTNLSTNLQRIRYLTKNINKRLQNTIIEHENIIDSIKNSNVSKSKEYLFIHLENAKQDLIKMYQEKGDQMGYYMTI